MNSGVDSALPILCRRRVSLLQNKTNHLTFLFCICLMHCPAVQNARILGMVPYFAKSHHRVYQPILKTLAEAGHELMVYSTFLLDNPPANYTNIYLDNMEITEDQLSAAVIELSSFPYWKCFDIHMLNISEIHLQNFLENEKIQQLIKGKEKFDLIIAESFVGQEYSLIFQHIFNAPLITLQTSPTNCITHSYSGNALSLSHMPNMCSPFSDVMSLYEKTINAFSVLRDLYVYYNKYLPSYEKKLQSLFPNIPPLNELITRVSLAFTNSHMTTDYPQPLTPNIIHIGGIHIPEQKPLPQDIKKFMDEAPEGVILFSLGTYVPDHLQSRDYFEMYINVFKRLKQRVLWKTMKSTIEGLPDNVMTLNWMPQVDILAHAKCVLFITHGGLLSQHETIHFGVPVIAIPQFFDQHRNAHYYEAKGVGIKLDPNELSQETISDAIDTILGRPEYRENMKKLSRIFRDRPMSPAQSVVFWTEYVLRHGGAAHLKPASTQLSWYQLVLLDVLASIILGFIFFLVALYFIFKIVIKILCKINFMPYSYQNIKNI